MTTDKQTDCPELKKSAGKANKTNGINSKMTPYNSEK